MPRKVRWEEMFRHELRDALSERPICYLAFGLAEPHGPQSALGLDWLKAHALCCRIAEAHGGVVAPPFCWHIHETAQGTEWLSRQNAPQPFLSNLPPDVFLRLVCYQLRAVEAAGFRAAMLISGHYGGVEDDIQRVAEAYSRHRPLRTFTCADWELMNYGGFNGDHAGVCETSQLWALRPKLVDLSHLPTEGDEKIFASTPASHGASKETGEKIVASQIAEAGKIVEGLLTQAERQGPSQRISFAETERIWRQVEAQRAHWLSSLSVEAAREYNKLKRAPLSKHVRERSLPKD